MTSHPSLADVGTRGAAWLRKAHPDSDHALKQIGDFASTSSHRLEPSFGNRIDPQDVASFAWTSHPLQIVPPFRAQGLKQQREGSTSSPSLRSRHPELGDVPQDCLLDLIQEDESDGRKSHTASTSKLLVTPYHAGRDQVLVIAVGGQDDRHIFIHVLQSPRDKRHRDNKKNSRHRREADEKEVKGSERKAILEQSFLPAFSSDSPITAITLAPASPTLPQSHTHEGPWISIQTQTALHFAAVHRLKRREREHNQAVLPSYVLMQICTFLTKDVARATWEEQERQEDAMFFTLNHHPVSDVAWSPADKTTAMIIDTGGQIWRWKVNTGGSRKWRARGQELEEVVKLDLRGTARQRCQVLWTDESDQDRATATTDHSLHAVDLEAGTSERCFTLSIHPRHLIRSSFLCALNLNLSSPVNAGDDATPRSPLLVVCSTTSLHVFNVCDLRKELLVIPHHRPIWDDTLSLAVLPWPRAQRRKEPCVSLVLSSVSHDAFSTVYTIGFETGLTDIGEEQACRAWQSHPPAEFSNSSQQGIGGREWVACPWKQLLPSIEPWQRWRIQQLQDRGSLACLSRDTRGAVMVQSLSVQKRHSTTIDLAVLPIDIPVSPAAQDLIKIVLAESGMATHRPYDRLQRQGRKAFATVVNLSTVFRSLSTAGQSNQLARSFEILHAFRDGAGTAAILEDPLSSMLTALDLLSSTSLQLGGIKSQTPFAAPQGLVSASYSPHRLHVNWTSAMPLLDILLGGLRRHRGQAWWEGKRWIPGQLRLQDGNSSEQDEAVDDDDRPTDVMDQVKALIRQYRGTVESQSSPLRTAALQVILHQILSQEVWSTRPIEIQRPQGLDNDIGSDGHQLPSDSRFASQGPAGLSQPGPWNRSEAVLPAFSQDRMRRQDSVAPFDGLGLSSQSSSRAQSQSSTSGRNRRRRDDSVDEEPPPALFDPTMSQADLFRNEAAMEEFEDGQEARRKVPEPEEVHFAYFQPRRRREGHDIDEESLQVTTPAARLLLSSWPLGSLDPKAAESDPSYYTYTDPYTLLDAAKEGGVGYASSNFGATSDEATAWSSAWSGGWTSATSGVDSDVSRRTNRSTRSVWSVAPSSVYQRGRNAETPGAGEASAAPTMDWMSPASSLGPRGRLVAPPSIGSSSQSLGPSRLRPSSQSLRPSSTLAGSSLGKRWTLTEGNDDTRSRDLPRNESERHSSSQRPSAPSSFGTQQEASTSAAAASQPVSGPHGGDLSSTAAGRRPAKKVKRRMGGF